MLHGKTALITGSAKGLGRRAAIELARLGCNIVLNYRTSRDDADGLARQLETDYGILAIAVRADMASTDDIQSLAEQAEALSGRVDILVNNAGPFIG